MTSVIKNVIDRLILYNQAYREGQPIVTDSEYDTEVELLRTLDPSHPFLIRVEPEKFQHKVKVSHPFDMLSIEKAYTLSALKLFVRRVKKKAKDICCDNVMFRLTAKLDGVAGRDNGSIFVSRGDGKVGYDISNAFTRGVIPLGGRGKGLGEVVVVKSYFDEKMASYFEHPRNMVVGVIASDRLNTHAKKALDNGKIHFIPYSIMDSVLVNENELLQSYEDLYTLILNGINYPVDGLVVEVINSALRKSMGFTAHHYRWQLALKTKGETAYTSVTNINWQIGRSGTVTPVIEVKPISVSGATIKRLTGHHAGNIRSLNIGLGTVIEVIRSGEVIPKIESVIETFGAFQVPTVCLACGEKLSWENNFLKCTNYECIARIEQRIFHWFRTLGNTKWFGIETIRKIANEGYVEIESIYALNQSDFKSIGFGEVQSKNLSNAIYKSIVTAVDDWRFLAALGIPGLGLSDSFKLLREMSIYDIPGLKKETIISIYGFGDKTSELIENGLSKVHSTVIKMLSMGFNLVITPIERKIKNSKSSLFGKKIVFTGKLKTGLRNKLENEARRIGLKVQNKIRQNTDYLICGVNSGKSKLDKARQMGLSVLTEDQYLILLNEESA